MGYSNAVCTRLCVLPAQAQSATREVRPLTACRSRRPADAQPSHFLLPPSFRSNASEARPRSGGYSVSRRWRLRHDALVRVGQPAQRGHMCAFAFCACSAVRRRRVARAAAAGRASAAAAGRRRADAADRGPGFARRRRRNHGRARVLDAQAAVRDAARLAGPVAVAALLYYGVRGPVWHIRRDVCAQQRVDARRLRRCVRAARADNLQGLGGDLSAVSRPAVHVRGHAERRLRPCGRRQQARRRPRGVCQSCRRRLAGGPAGLQRRAQRQRCLRVALVLGGLPGLWASVLHQRLRHLVVADSLSGKRGRQRAVRGPAECCHCSFCRHLWLRVHDVLHREAEPAVP